MKKYEYKFVKAETKLGPSFGPSIDRKLEEEQAIWNKLGQEGRLFCKEGTNVLIFVRELPQAQCAVKR